MKINLERLQAQIKPVDLRHWPRIIPQRHRLTPASAGFGSSRFSSPSNAFCVLYAAANFQTAFAEAVVRDRFVGRTKRYIGQKELTTRAVTEISTTAPLDLLDLTRDASYNLGIDTDAKSARDHKAGQKFAEHLFNNTPSDGILYDSRMTGGPCVAIFDRAFGKLSATTPINLIQVGALKAELTSRDIIVRPRIIIVPPRIKP